MKQVTYIVVFAAIIGCARHRDSSEDPSQTSIERSEQGISVVPVIDTVVVSQDQAERKGILYKIRIKNQTGEKIFLVKPSMQIWKSDGKMEPFKLFPRPQFDLRLFKLVDSLRGTRFMDNQKALALADQIISNSPNVINTVDMQRRIFANAILFLDINEEKEIGMGITYLKDWGVKFKIVAVNDLSPEKFNHILGPVPDTFEGFKYWQHQLHSDTITLNLEKAQARH